MKLKNILRLFIKVHSTIYEIYKSKIDIRKENYIKIIQRMLWCGAVQFSQFGQ